jgi:hypothetical protein
MRKKLSRYLSELMLLIRESIRSLRQDTGQEGGRRCVFLKMSSVGMDCHK